MNYEICVATATGICIDDLGAGVQSAVCRRQRIQISAGVVCIFIQVQYSCTANDVSIMCHTVILHICNLYCTVPLGTA